MLWRRAPPVPRTLSTSSDVVVRTLPCEALTPSERDAWNAALASAPGAPRTQRIAELLATCPDALRVSPWPTPDGPAGSLLHVAAEMGDADLVRHILTSAGAAIASIVDEDGQSALHCAVSHGRLTAARCSAARAPGAGAGFKPNLRLNASPSPPTAIFRANFPATLPVTLFHHIFRFGSRQKRCQPSNQFFSPGL